MEEALRALLTGYAPLTALVSTRIFWNAIPQGTADPCVVLYKVDGAPHYQHSGADSLETSRVQINVRAVSTTSAWAVSRAIKTKLSGFAGVQSGIRFGGIFVLDERQSSEKPDTTLYHSVSMDFEVHSAAI